MKTECKIEDGKLFICSSLEEKTQLSNSHKKGFVAINVFNMKTGKEKFIGIAYKKDANDRGSMLNYCPWCGKKIQNWDDKSE